jgi:hypothetical protein
VSKERQAEPGRARCLFQTRAATSRATTADHELKAATAAAIKVSTLASPWGRAEIRGSGRPVLCAAVKAHDVLKVSLVGSAPDPVTTVPSGADAPQFDLVDIKSFGHVGVQTIAA